MNPRPDDDALSWAGENDPTLAADTTLPDTEVPDATARDAAVRDAAVSDTTVPDTTVSDPAVPDTAVTGQWVATPPVAPVTAATTTDPTAAAPVAVGADSVRGSAALVLTGILAGIYLLYTIGWFIGIGRINNPAGEPVAAFMFALGTWLAVAAPAVWFGVSYALTNGQPRIRLTWLIIGVVLLAPVPFILGSGTGA